MTILITTFNTRGVKGINHGGFSDIYPNPMSDYTCDENTFRHFMNEYRKQKSKTWIQGTKSKEPIPDFENLVEENKEDR